MISCMIFFWSGEPSCEHFIPLWWERTLNFMDQTINESMNKAVVTFYGFYLLHVFRECYIYEKASHFISTLTSSVTAELCYMKPAARFHVSLNHTSVSQHTPAATCCEAHVLICWLSSQMCSTYVRLRFPQSLSDPQSCSCYTLFKSARVVCAQRSQKAGMDVHLEPDD